MEDDFIAQLTVSRLEGDHQVPCSDLCIEHYFRRLNSFFRLYINIYLIIYFLIYLHYVFTYYTFLIFYLVTIHLFLFTPVEILERGNLLYNTR